MKTLAPALLPVFRSRLVGELLALLLADSERTWTMDDLAQRTGAAYQTVTREVRQLQLADLVHSRTVGRSKLLKANPDNPYLQPLTELVLRSFGPPLVIAEEFADVGGVERLFIYGSWAARRVGQRGRTPQDVDVLVLGQPDRDQVYQAATRSEQRLGLEVNPTVRPSAAWDQADDAFARTVKESPMVELTIPRSEKD